MEVKNLFDSSAKQEIIERIQRLSPDKNPLWGKMNAAQMLAHCQMPVRIAMGLHEPKGSFLLRLIGPAFKSKLWDSQPYKKGLPTDPTFIMTGSEKDFITEKTELIDLVTNFTEETITRDRHPIFGKLTKTNWSMATWKHLDHHLRQFGV